MNCYESLFSSSSKYTPCIECLLFIYFFAPLYCSLIDCVGLVLRGTTQTVLLLNEVPAAVVMNEEQNETNNRYARNPTHKLKAFLQR